MKLSETLAGYLKAWRPVIYVHGNDFETIDAEITGAVRDANGQQIEEYNNAQGRVRFDTKVSYSSLDESGILALPSAQRLASYLNMFLVDVPASRVVVLKDVHRELTDSAVCASLKAIAWRLSNVDGYAVQVVIVSSCKVIPLDLEKEVTVLEFGTPSAAEITQRLTQYCKKCLERNVMMDMPTGDSLDELALALRGLDYSEIERVLNYVQTQTGGSLDPSEAVRIILDEKKQVIQKSSLLETVEVAYSDES